MTTQDVDLSIRVDANGVRGQAHRKHRPRARSPYILLTMIHHIRDYDVLRSGTKDGSERSVIAILIERRRGRLPVGSVKVSGQGDPQWTAADGRIESIGSSEFPVEADVMTRLWSPAGLMLAEVDRESEPTGEQWLKLAAL